ncbi:MAG: hypothetical protein QG664_698 [Patescibacteria group bacterium]|nr:hypothetical protein [Patescibacteria group bacterium]
MLQPLNKTLFSVLALFFITAAAFVSLDTFRGYRAEVTVLVLPLSTNQTPAEQMVENIAILPTTVSFLDALLESDGRLSEFSDLDEQSINARSEQWNEMLAVRREGGSGIVTYTIKADTQEEATIFARQMAKVLFQKIGTYYDIRSEVSLRLIEGPLVRASLISPVTWVVLSVSIGIVAALSLMVLGVFLRLLIGTPRRKTATPTAETLSPVSRPTDTAYPAIHPDTFVPKKPTVLFSEEGEARAREEKREYNPYVITPNSQQVSGARNEVTAPETVALPVAPIETVSATSTTQPIAVEPLSTPTSIATTKSAAPANLPFIDEATFLAQFSSEATPESAPPEPDTDPIQPMETEQEPVTPSLPAEPTMEDYRRRLNELLKEGK